MTAARSWADHHRSSAKAWDASSIYFQKDVGCGGPKPRYRQCYCCSADAGLQLLLEAEEVRVKRSPTDTDSKSSTKAAEREKRSQPPLAQLLAPFPRDPTAPPPSAPRRPAQRYPAPGPPSSPTPIPEARPARSPSVPSAAGKPHGSEEAPARTRRRKLGTPRNCEGWRGLGNERLGVPRGRPLAAGGPAAPRGVPGPVVLRRPDGSHRRASSVAGWLHGGRLPVSRGRRAAAGRRSAEGSAGKALLGADLGWLCPLWALCEFSVQAAEVQRACVVTEKHEGWPWHGLAPAAGLWLRVGCAVLCCAVSSGRRAAALFRSCGEAGGDLFGW